MSVKRKPRKAKRKPRKPKALMSGMRSWAEIEPEYGYTAHVWHQNVGPGSARRLAKWLLAFADWASSRAKKGGAG